MDNSESFEGYQSGVDIRSEEDIKDSPPEESSNLVKESKSYKPIPNMRSPEPPSIPGVLSKSTPVNPFSMNSTAIAVQFDKMNVKMDAIVGWIKQFYSRFAVSLKDIEELKSKETGSEKKVSEVISSFSKEINALKKSNYEKAGLDAKREEKINSILKNMEINKKNMGQMSQDIDALKKRADVFIGTEEILKLNDQVKQDLIEVKKLESGVRMDADKTEQIFVELKNTLSKIEKMNKELGDLEGISSQLGKEIDRLKVSSKEIEQIKKAQEKTNDLAEKTNDLAIENQKAIGNFSYKDYEDKIDLILSTFESLADKLPGNTAGSSFTRKSPRRSSKDEGSSGGVGSLPRQSDLNEKETKDGKTRRKR